MTGLPTIFPGSAVLSPLPPDAVICFPVAKVWRHYRK